MSRMDQVIVRRLLSNIGLTLAVLFGILMLSESLNAGRFSALTKAGGLPLAFAGILVASARWIIDTLPFTFLVGSIAGLLSLQASREMTVMKASGRSVWQLMRAPLVATILGGLLVALVFDTAVVLLNREISPNAGRSNDSGTLWLDERRTDIHYVLEAGYVHPSGRTLSDVSIFVLDAPRDRIEAPQAELQGRDWILKDAIRYRANEGAVALPEYRLPTSRSAGDIRARIASVADLTAWELAGSLASRLNDPDERAEVETRFLRLVGLPLSLCGSLVIAFAFTAGYRRTNKYGGAVLYGIVLGVLVYVVTEMAGRAGGAGVMHPVVAVAGPAVVAIVIGVTVLLNKEDGRT